MNAAVLSDQDVAEMITAFVSRQPAEKSLHAFGYAETTTSTGIGLIRTGYKSYEPRYDLKNAAIEIADLLSADKYEATSVEIATDLPEIWLSSKDNTSLTKALNRTCAGVTIHADLRKGMSPDGDSQMCVVFFVEMKNEADAQTLLKLSREKHSDDTVILGTAEKELFCLLVTKSWVQGVKTFETPKDIGRFSKGFTDILRRHTANKLGTVSKRKE